MTKEKTLIITDNLKGGWLDRIAAGQFETSVLTLGITPEYFMRFNRRKGHSALGSVRFVKVDDIYEEAQRRIGEFYINFIFELPQKVKQGLFSHKGKNLWWFLELTEKCPVRSKIINRLFYLELSRHVISSGAFERIYIDIEDHLTARTILKWKPDKIRYACRNMYGQLKALFYGSTLYFICRYLANCLGLFLLFCVRSAALRLSGIKGAMPSGDKMLFFFTNYPFWWNDAYRDYAAEKFMGSLPEHLARSHAVFYAAWLFSLNPLRILFKKKSMRDFFLRKKMVLLEMMLKVRDKSKVLSFGYLVWALSVRSYFKRPLKYFYEGFDISGLLYYEMCRSLSHIELFNDILMESALKKLNERYPGQALVYRLEFQPFEKAILAPLSRRYKTVAFQHSTFSRNHLAYFFAPGEIPFHLDGRNGDAAMPLPDIIITTGGYFRDIMMKAEFPCDRMEVAGPLRYRSIVSYLKEGTDKAAARKRLGVPESEKMFIVVMNWIEEETMSLVSSLFEAGAEMDGKFHFVFRSHPHKNYDNIVSAFLDKETPPFRYSFFNKDFSLYDAISASDGVIQIATSLGYESLAIGRVPIVYENKHVFNFNSSEELKGRVPIVSSSGELKDAIYSVIDGGEAMREMRRKWPEILKKFFYDLEGDPQSRFDGLLKKHGMLDQGIRA